MNPFIVAVLGLAGIVAVHETWGSNEPIPVPMERPQQPGEWRSGTDVFIFDATPEDGGDVEMPIPPDPDSLDPQLPLLDESPDPAMVVPDWDDRQVEL
jgi:hypothetical protein